MKTYTAEQHAEMLNDLRAAEIPYPEGEHEGRGVVICGGGMKLFTCAWVCIRMLRRAGCDLPIELWHLGQREMSRTQKELIERFGVKTVDALAMKKKRPVRILNGWELKPYAIMHSSFRHVMLLDADNVPIRNPAFLFDSQQYEEFGALFWPDFGRLARDRSIWKICGLEYVDEPEFESGQIFVDKARCWKPLKITMHLNEHSDFYYRHIHGDKETFHMGWRIAGQPWAMPERRIHRLHCTMCQHDFQGERLFQHRNLDKWSLARGANVKIQGFELEQECFDLLDELRVAWEEGGTLNPVTEDERQAARRTIGQRWIYRRIGHDERPMTFLPDGQIGEGSERCESRWNVGSDADGVILRLMGRDALTATFRWEPDPGRWFGAWVDHEKMPCELVPQAAPQVKSE